LALGAFRDSTESGRAPDPFEFARFFGEDRPSFLAEPSAEEHRPVMPAKAGIQKGFPEALDSRLRGNDTTVDGDSPESVPI
jgi:hypothetical protein